jgi:hypothetical protein
MWRSSWFMSCELFATADCSQGFHHASLIMTARQICCQPSSWPLPSTFVCFWKCCSCSPVRFLCILRGCHIGHHQIECSVALWRNVVSLWDFIPSPKYPIFGAPHLIPSLLLKALCLGAYLGRPRQWCAIICQILRCPKLDHFFCVMAQSKKTITKTKEVWVHSQLIKPLNAW